MGNEPKGKNNPARARNGHGAQAVRHSSGFRPPSGAMGKLSLPASRKPASACSRLPSTIRIVLKAYAQRRRQESQRRTRTSSPTGARRQQDRRDPVRRRPSSSRTSPGSRCWPIRRDANGLPTWARTKTIEPGAGGSGRRPLGDDRFIAVRRARSQHEARVRNANGERYQFINGMQAFDTFKVKAARHRHRSPGQLRIPGARRSPARWSLLPGYAGRHRQPYDDDQRHRRRWLGVGGIEAEAGMLGQPVYFLTPDVVACTCGRL